MRLVWFGLFCEPVSFPVELSSQLVFGGQDELDEKTAIQALGDGEAYAYGSLAFEHRPSKPVLRSLWPDRRAHASSSTS